MKPLHQSLHVFFRWSPHLKMKLSAPNQTLLWGLSGTMQWTLRRRCSGLTPYLLKGATYHQCRVCCVCCVLRVALWINSFVTAVVCKVMPLKGQELVSCPLLRPQTAIWSGSVTASLHCGHIQNLGLVWLWIFLNYWTQARKKLVGSQELSAWPNTPALTFHVQMNTHSAGFNCFIRETCDFCKDWYLGQTNDKAPSLVNATATGSYIYM